MSITRRKANTFQLVENCQTKPSTSYSIFHGKIALQPIPYATKMFAAKVPAAKMSMAKKLPVKIPATLTDISSPYFRQWKALKSQARHLTVV